ncbi:MAG: hypothetical protein R2759_01685 [Bacteroidales bacterium]
MHITIEQRANFDLKNWEKAITDLDKTIDLNPQYDIAYVLRGNLKRLKLEISKVLVKIIILHLIWDEKKYKKILMNIVNKVPTTHNIKQLGLTVCEAYS